MKKTVAATVACGALAAIVVGCAPLRQATPPVRLPTSRPAALAIVGGHLAADHGEVSGLVAQTAQPNEHLEIIDPSAGQGGTVDPPVAPGVGPLFMSLCIWLALRTLSKSATLSMEPSRK